ncbi:hypothetical protein [Clostridium saccharobutylicum]|uniref:Uncharacterized protein n=1 Tax=Clostridium saccharobutylicum TaxID=169679 RepID=A0A1S8NJB8_CLOSA|nr:hypothetical protein [Clostridium saccharobutylicum]OOM16518.1 hypothetical protein CLOSAC_07890 [Clostridium saccharobutylicum]
MDKNASGKIKYYGKILKRYQNVVDFYTSSQKLLKNMPKDLSYEDSVIYQTSLFVTAPVLTSYILYILKDAQKRGMQKLYFLSRDGYVMYKIAKVICEKYNIEIECKYIYVSRLVLRAPLYLIDEKEAMERFCECGAQISAKVVLERAGIKNEVQNKILNDLNMKFKEKSLNKVELKELGQILKENELFVKEARDYAQKQYENIYDYFIQEGLNEDKTYAIVDTGWMGSMQRHINQILSYSGIDITMHGYYFGMFEKGKKEDGEYNCFYFSKEYKGYRRVLFNNNLFECMCSANHGMTIGYYRNDHGTIMPIFNEYKAKWNVSLQLKTVEHFAEIFVNSNKWINISAKQLSTLVEKLLIRFMIFPSFDEAFVYGHIPFCDDSTESYMINLADMLTKDELWKYSIFYKIYKKIFLKNEEEKFHESFWINGTIQLVDVPYKRLINLNCILSEYIHYLILKNKSN